uniref:Uncharacterized protein n=1 Tax=Cuerna arida TaxID=1464854 RepID=A0A1B6GWB4_9HEMI
MLKKQNKDPEDTFDFTGTLQLTMFRIMSMPQPPNQKINKKKVKHTLRIEMYCPELLSYIPEREEDFIEDFTLLNDNTDKNLSDKKTKGKNTNKTDESSTKKSKSGEPDSAKCFEGDPLYEAILKENQPDTKLCFVSEQKSWGKIIEFSDPTIEVPMSDLVSLRNVFRSNLILCVVHLKTLPPPIKKKKNKQKAKGKQGSLEEINSDMDSNKEILVSKSTIAAIKIPLQNIIWNVKSLDYTWSITMPSKVEFTPGLKDLQYSMKKKKPPKKAKGKEEVSTELQIPNSFTCHIGIGLKRVQTNNNQ